MINDKMHSFDTTMTQFLNNVPATNVDSVDMATLKNGSVSMVDGDVSTSAFGDMAFNAPSFGHVSQDLSQCYSPTQSTNYMYDTSLKTSTITSTSTTMVSTSSINTSTTTKNHRKSIKNLPLPPGINANSLEAMVSPTSRSPSPILSDKHKMGRKNSSLKKSNVMSLPMPPGKLIRNYN